MDERQKRLVEELLSKEGELPSLAKGLFLGKVDSERAFPFPEMTHSEKFRYEAFEKEFLEWAKREIDGDAIDRAGEIPESVIKGLGELGVLGFTVPKEWGGLGFSQTAYCKIMEKIAERCSSTALFINAHHSIGLKAVLLFGTEEQKTKWLKRMARGESIAAFSLTEPTAGSDAGGIKTKAVWNPEKRVYSISGVKQWTTSGSIAKMLTLMARTEIKGESKVTAFLVTPEMKGFHVTAKALEKVGMRGTKTSNLAFEEMEVPEENVLGPLGHGLRVCLTVLDYGRTTFGATCTGVAKLCVDRAVKHATSRIQFGKPLIAFELVEEKIKRMEAVTYAMESLTYLVAGQLDQGKSDIMLEAAILKVFNSEEEWITLYDTMQIFGGRSFFTDEPFERMMRDARLNMIGEGSNEVLRVFIAVVGMRELGMKLKKGFLKTLFSLFRKPEVPVKSRELQAAKRELERDVRKFALKSARLLIRFREEIAEEQLILNGIADAVISLLTRIAVLSRAESEKRDFEKALIYSKLAKERFDRGIQ